MASFITRVELHEATDEDYAALHSEMAARRFAKTILGDDGVRYNLPTAEYYSFGDLSASSVRNLAVAAAKVTKRAHWVLVSKFDEAAWVLVPR